MSTLSQFMGGGIKSVQRGSVQGSSTNPNMRVTISPVNMQKTFCNLLTTSEYANIALTNSSTLEIDSSARVSWEVIEFY